MNVLVLGSGGREHALSWKISQSTNCNKLFVSPGNAGTQELAKNVILEGFPEISSFIIEESIDLLIVGPEAPLVEGIIDYLGEKHPDLLLIGPDKLGATLEGSKDFAKSFMAEFNIPTAKYKTFTADSLELAYDFLAELKSPYVLKADGLAAGKGVLIIDNLEEAKLELKHMLVDSKFGKASKSVVIEEYLNGIEMSVFVLTDGKDYLILPEAKDYKRIGEGDTGLNTGGMGAVSPVPFVNKDLREKIEERIVKPTVSGIKARGFKYNGFVFIGLMIVEGNPYVIEYNVRMGDPETEVVIPRIESDLLSHLKACAEGTLGKEELKISSNYATTVMMVSGGYPESYEKGKEILVNSEILTDELLFHAGTKIENTRLESNGGRVMAATGLGKTKDDALKKSYELVQKVQYDKKVYRSDIGQDL